MSRWLALDTSTDTVLLALQDGERLWQRELPGGAHASAELIPALLALLSEAGLALPQLQALVFGRGPGAFTGVRTACSVVQGLAFGADLPVLPVDSLLAVAEDARVRAGVVDRPWAVQAVLDACFRSAREGRAVVPDWAE